MQNQGIEVITVTEALIEEDSIKLEN